MWLQPQGVSKLRCPYFDVTLQFLQLNDSLQQILHSMVFTSYKVGLMYMT